MSEVVADELTHYILESNLPEGTKLQPEREMAESLNVGRTTLREALRLLESRGLLTIRAGPQGGPRVRHPKPANLGEALALILQFEGVTGADLIAARISLEGAVAQAAARVARPEDLDELRGCNDLVLDELSDEGSFLDTNRRFHEVLAQASGNRVLEMYVAALLAVGDGRALGARYEEAARRSVHAAHRVILDAVASGDTAASEAAMRRHLAEAERYWRRHFPSVLDGRVRWTE